MPFEKLIPRPLTLGSIQTYAPGVSGVYGITNAHEWIHIGKSDDIRASLLAHLRDDRAALMAREPIGFVFEACVEPYRSSRQDRLTWEYKPTCSLGLPRQAQAAAQRRQYGA